MSDGMRRRAIAGNRSAGDVAAMGVLLPCSIARACGQPVRVEDTAAVDADVRRQETQPGF